MRIIAGKYRGRRLDVPVGRRIRPTGDRMKESMFSALGQACRGARVLDLFAGSGALGLEALSRGASEVTFVEKESASIAALKKNIRARGVENECIVVQTEVFSFLKGLEKGISFDLIFADPPFTEDSARAILSCWRQGRLRGSVLILEYPTTSSPKKPADSLQVAKTGHFGESSYSIYLWHENCEVKVKTGLYPGTFDPITLGHLDIVKRSLRLVDRLVIAVASKADKATTFNTEERAEMIRESLVEIGINLEVEIFDGLLVDYATRIDAQVIFRGLRAVSDFEYEFQMALMNKKMAPEVEEVFLTPDQKYIYLSSSLVKEVASLGGDVSDLVTVTVEKRLRKRLSV